MSMHAFAEAAELDYADHPDDESNWGDHALARHDNTHCPANRVQGARVRAWRLGHGLRSYELGATFRVTGSAIRAWECGRNPVPHCVLAYIAARPVPPPHPEFPPTPEGLRRALSQWPSQRAWCGWWGAVSYQAVWRWLRQQHPIAPEVRRWLSAGAPLTWEGRPTVEDARPPSPPIGPTPDWVPLPGLGYAPPAGYCDPERDALRLPGCAWCCYRAECAALAGVTA